jgi:hypothetical protein
LAPLNDAPPAAAAAAAAAASATVDEKEVAFHLIFTSGHFSSILKFLPSLPQDFIYMTFKPITLQAATADRTLSAFNSSFLVARKPSVR